MFSKFLSRRKNREQETNIDMTPMLDIVFIMLIFFIVTTSFVKETALVIKRPSQSMIDDTCAPPNEADCPKPIVLVINADDVVSLDDRIISTQSISANLQARLADDPRSPLLIRIHNDSSANSLITTVDQAKMIGISRPTVSKWQ